ncbi:hypothetical protein [Chryseobacterium sp. Mn2064]|uniref:hypothetical protein n=1 Tax=Chryseobacterium sp. Mn2064 TaxID=3395263 RepID=UPI003BC3CA26
MKLLLFSLLTFPVAFIAQKKDRPRIFPKVDTTKIQNKDLFKNWGTNSVHQQKDLYKLMNIVPKDTTIYVALKESHKDYSKYKILNSITPEKLNIETKKAVPSK